MKTAKAAGISLVEVLVALIVFSLVAGATHRLLQRGASGAESRGAHRETETMLRTAALFLGHEMRGLGSRNDTSDIISFSSDSMIYRAGRAHAVACGVTPVSLDIRLDRYFGYRLPQPGRDSLAMFTDDGVWVAAGIAAVGGGSCAGKPAIRIVTPVDTSRTGPGTPLRIFEMMEARLYSSSGWQLGARSLSSGGGIQPLAGPLAAGGLQLQGVDSAGGSTVMPGRVAGFAVHVAAPVRPVRSLAGEGVRTSDVDSLTTFTMMRNGTWGHP